MSDKGRALETVGIVVLFGMATYFTLEAIHEWNRHPTVTISSWTPLKDMEFPAITVCPLQDARWRGFLEILRKTDPDGSGALDLYQKMGDGFHNKTLDLVTELIINQTNHNAFMMLSNNIDLFNRTLNNFTDAALVSEDPYAIMMMKAFLSKNSHEISREAVLSVLKGYTDKPNETLVWVVNVTDSAGNISNIVINSYNLNKELRPISLARTFYEFVQKVEFPDQGGHVIQSFLIDYLTQKERHFPDLNFQEWDLVKDYLGHYVSVEGIPGTILYDMANVAKPIVNSLMDVNCYGQACKLNWNRGPYARDPSIWQYHHRLLASNAYNCFLYHGNSSCNYLTNSTSHIPRNFSLDILDFLETTQQPVHFPGDSTGGSGSGMYQYPMIPFCWFGGPLLWLGDVIVNIPATSYAYDFYQESYQQNDPRKLLRWCNVFKKTFPIKSNCHTVDNLHQEVQQVGADYGFSFLLENYFGQNTYQKMKTSHIMYLHEKGTLPDRFSILGKGIQLEYGKKHEITITAGHQRHTQSFAGLSASSRNCILQNESEKHRGTFKIADKYATTTCIIEQLLEISNERCQCMPWDVSQFLNQSKIPLCLHIGRICVEKTWNNRSNIRIASEKCPTPCEQWDYFVREMTLSNLNENAMVIDLPNQAMPSFTVAYFTAPHFNNVTNDLVTITWKNISNLELNQERTKYMTMVSVNFGAGYGTVLESDVRASFSDKLGTIGGTFGIFVGVSFLSIGSLICDMLSQAKRKLTTLLLKLTI